MTQRTRTGSFRKISTGSERYEAFLPAPLPPKPPIAFDGDLQHLLERASRALGRLDGVTVLFPDPALFLMMYIRKEAVLSSQIEGTQSSLSDLLLFESDDDANTSSGDVREVANYVIAMEYGLQRLRDGFPLSLRLIREIHAKLMDHTRGGDKTPGEFRRSQNWIGGGRPGTARFVPPPPEEMKQSLSDLERFIHDDAPMPLVIKAGLVHAQFETIHPFLDGNGRIGRLLITFLLCANGALSQPLLYLSLYLKANRDTYYDALQLVRTHGDWETWIRFYLQGIESVALQATDTARRVMQLFDTDRDRIAALGRASGSVAQVHKLLCGHAVVSVPQVVNELHLSKPTAGAALDRLIDLGIVREITGRQRNRHFAYRTYLDILSEGTADHGQLIV
jgi:Fic family protein